MKSIIEEASSIIKAIEKGWEKAGKPETFSVKIYEYPQKNFIGLTTRSAKIGIFFDEKKLELERKHAEPKHEKRITRPLDKPERIDRQSKKSVDKSIEKTEKPFAKPEQKAIQRPLKTHERVFWTDHMVDLSKEWLTHLLQIIHKEPVTFTMEVTNHQLTVVLNKPILIDNDKERNLLRNLSIFLLQTLRHKFKRPLRGFKVIFTSRV